MGGGRALERRVEEAEHATGQVVEHQRQHVSDAVPRRAGEQARSMEPGIAAAMESLGRVLAQGHAVEESLRDPGLMGSVMGAYSEMIRVSIADAFRQAERGHEAPASVYRTEAEARAHSEEILHEARQDAASRQAEQPRQADQHREERGFWERLWGGITSFFQAIGDFFEMIGRFLGTPFRLIRDAISDEIIDTNSEISREVSSEWLSEEYLGSVIHARFARTPPVTTGEAQEFFDEVGLAREARRDPDVLGYGHGSSGTYYNGTNHITVIANEPERGEMSDPGQADRYVRNAHEQLHYASWLGGGHDIRWRDEEGRPASCGYIQWLHEGLTELHAQQLARSHGHEPTYVSYPYETAAGFYMQQIVGEGTLRTAYLTGDFTEVRSRLDARLGAGAFDQLAGMQRGAEALTFITGRMARAGMDITQWEADPVLAGCFSHIARLEG